ncbi:MAG: integrin alpha [Candidatus Thorarchaeota archaeon]
MAKMRKFGCFVVLMLAQLSMLLLPSTGSTQLNDGVRITIYDLVSQGKAVAFTTPQVEWLGAYSANTRVNDINNDTIDDFLIGGDAMRIFFGHTGQWSNHSVFDADATIISGLSPGLSNQISNPVGAGDLNNDGFPDVLLASFWGPVNRDPLAKAFLFFGGNSTAWTIDTPVSDADAIFIAEAEGNFLGHGMDGVGDVNADGYDDFVITSEFNDQAHDGAGKAYLVLGRATTAWNISTNIGEAASASFLGTEVDGWFGMNAAGVGDVNNDGFDDFLLGGATHSTERLRENYLVFGRPTPRWQKDVPKTDVVNVTFRFKTEDQLGGAAGRFMSGVGDVNGDSLDDFIVGAYKDDEGGTDTGQSFLFLGRSQDHWPPSPALVDAADYANASFIGETVNERAGYSVSGAGDINADGYDDILIGASNAQSEVEGKAYVIFGRATNQWTMDQSLSKADLIVAGGQDIGVGNRFATDVSGIGDINDDGYADFSISASWVEYRRGMIFVVFGGSAWAPTVPTETTTTQSSPAWTLVIMMLSLAALVFRRGMNP